MWRLVSIIGLLVAACAEVPVDEAPAGDDKGVRGGGAGFTEVNPRRSSAAVRTYVERAGRELEQDDSQIARLTAASIRAGRVKIDELVDLTCWDFERVRKDVPDLRLTSADYARLVPGGALARALAGEIDGYMWSNRVYVSRGQSTRSLAATLVHETNHVINRSEVGYWDDLPTSAFRHEYRAFYAEAMFDADAYDGVDLTAHVIELYDLDRRRIRASVLAAPLSPRLLPDTAAWSARNVAGDPRDDDATCPGAR